MALKMGIIGYGGMGHWHVGFPGQLDGVDFIAAYDIDPKRLEQAKEDGMTAYATLEAFLADKRTNFVLVATPNHTHKELAIKAMEAGKHVMVEKPATLSSKDFEEMMAVSKRCGVILTAHQNRRWDRDFLTAMKTINDGYIGKPYAIMSTFLGQRGMMHGWRAVKEYGGGMVLDWGVHLFDQILTGFPDLKVKTVFAQLATIKNPGVDDYFKVQFTMSDGMFVEIECGTYGLKPHSRWIVYGDKGAFNIKDFGCNEGSISLTDYELANADQGDKVVMTAAGPTRTMAPLQSGIETLVPLPVVDDTGITKEPGKGQGLWPQLYLNLKDVVDNGAELKVKPESVLRNIKLMEAVFESAAKGTSLEINL